MSTGGIMVLIFCATGFWHFIDRLIEWQEKRRFSIETALEDIQASIMEQYDNWAMVQVTLDSYINQVTPRDVSSTENN